MPSDLFERVFTSAGSPVVTCGFCGVTYFARYYLDDEELATLLSQQKEQPKRYIELDWDGVSWGTLDDREFVPDCSCNVGDRYEKFLWRNRVPIMEYLRTRLRDIAKRAQSELEHAQETPNAK